MRFVEWLHCPPRVFALSKPNVQASASRCIAISASGKRAYVGTSFGHILSIDLAAADNTTTLPDPVVHDLSNMGIHSVQGMSISPDATHLLAVDNDDVLHFVNLVNNADADDGSVGVAGGPVALGEFTLRDSIFVSGFQN